MKIDNFLNTKKYLSKGVVQGFVIVPLIVQYVLYNCVKDIFNNKKYFKSMITIHKDK